MQSCICSCPWDSGRRRGEERQGACTHVRMCVRACACLRSGWCRNALAKQSAHRQVQNGGCGSEARGALTDLGCFLAPNNGRLVSNLLGPESLQVSTAAAAFGSVRSWCASSPGDGLVVRGAAREARRSKVSFVLFPLRCWCACRAVAGCPGTGGLVFLSLGWVRKTAPNPGRSKMAGLGR